MAAFLLVLAVMVGAWILAIGMCQAGAREDRARARIIDLEAQRRLRALGDAVKRHPSGGDR
jgi:hypothetical protein